MKVIEISETNYQDYSSLDIVAFSYATAGGMGEGGGIYIIDREGQIYHANCYRGDNCIKQEHIKDIIPVYGNITRDFYDREFGKGDWAAIYLGAFNQLVFLRSLIDDIMKIIKTTDFVDGDGLYQHWPGIIMDILGKGDINLTLKDIKKM